MWLLPMALLGMLALAWQGRPRFREDRKQQSLILWGTWLLTMAVFFSIATFFHQYYLSTFAPAICALFGIGVVVMWRLRRLRRHWTVVRMHVSIVREITFYSNRFHTIAPYTLAAASKHAAAVHF